MEPNTQLDHIPISKLVVFNQIDKWHRDAALWSILCVSMIWRIAPMNNKTPLLVYWTVIDTTQVN
jgi:hypothetical protein